MRILFILHQFFPEFHGGTERVALNIARMAQRAGHYVHVLACTVDPEKSCGNPGNTVVQGSFDLVYQGLPVTLIPRSMLPSTGDISVDTDESMVNLFTDWMRKERFDVAHVMHTMRMGSAVLAVQRCGLPYVLTLTDFFLPCARINLTNVKGKSCSGPDRGHRCAKDCAVAPWTPTAYIQRFEQTQTILAAAGARIAPSEYVAQRYRQSFNAASVQVIPHGIDFLAMGVAFDSTHELFVNPVETRLVFIGSIVPQKGLDVLLQALARLPEAAFTLKIVGAFFGHPAYAQQIKTLVSADPRVELLGAMDTAQVAQVLGKSDLLCLPSVIPESFSLVLHEGAAAGVPALVCDLGAPAQQVQHHGCGRVVAAGDVQAWADALRDVAHHSDTVSLWKKKLFLPLRVEEEAFFYESIYMRLRQPATQVQK